MNSAKPELGSLIDGFVGCRLSDVFRGAILFHGLTKHAAKRAWRWNATPFLLREKILQSELISAGFGGCALNGKGQQVPQIGVQDLGVFVRCATEKVRSEYVFDMGFDANVRGISFQKQITEKLVFYV
jgi:hypothetical protein